MVALQDPKEASYFSHTHMILDTPTELIKFACLSHVCCSSHLFCLSGSAFRRCVLLNWRNDTQASSPALRLSLWMGTPPAGCSALSAPWGCHPSLSAPHNIYFQMIPGCYTKKVPPIQATVSNNCPTTGPFLWTTFSLKDSSWMQLARRCMQISDITTRS